MSAFEEILTNIEISRVQNEQLQKELEDLQIEQEILKEENNEMHYEIINLESLIKKYGAEPISLRRTASKILREDTEENKYANDEKIMEFTFEFKIPEELHNESDLDVNILGNFTQWIPQPMQKDDKDQYLYKFTALLERGFKHRYQFLINGDEYIDKAKKSSVNPTGSVTNYLMVPLLMLEKMSGSNISSFMCQDIDSPALFNYPSYVPAEMAKILKKVSTNDTANSDSIKEYVVEQINHWSELLKKKQVIQKKLGNPKDKNNKILQAQHKELDKEYWNIGRNLKKILQGRIVHTLDFDAVIYEIVEYYSAENYIKVRMIYDQNKILISEDSSQAVKVFYPADIEKELKFLTIKEEARIRVEMLKEYHIFKILYQIDESTGEKICLPMSIEPSWLHLSEYSISFDKNEGKIQYVNNNLYGPVKFSSAIIDYNAGYISNSEFKIWTNEVNEQVYNIIHCHINDMSDSVPIATEYLSNSDSISDYLEFKADSSGQMLRYKILIQNHRILSVLYNSGASVDEIPFLEIKLSYDDAMLQAIIPEVFGEDPIIVEIDKLPKSMTWAHDKKALEKMNIETVENEPLTNCKMRYFERLPGYIDVKMVSADNCSSLYEGEYRFSIPACLCKPIDDFQKTMIASMKEFQKEQAIKGVKSAIDHLVKLNEKYSIVKIKTLEEMKDAFSELKTAEEKINQHLSNGIEDQELVDIAKDAASKTSKILRGMAAEMRILSMKSK